MLDETFSVPELVAELSIDISEFADDESTFDRDELLSRTDDLIEQLLNDQELDMPVSMLKALEMAGRVN